VGNVPLEVFFISILEKGTLMSELVSILIPAYNAEKWIGDTIRSVLDQTCPRKEIIIVDDGSKDSTLAIAKQFASGFVKVISQENKGASAARNTALEHAQGDYIQWLDADDLLGPDKISEQMKKAENGRTSLTLLSSSFGTFYWRPRKAIFRPNALWQDLSPVEWFLERFRYNLWVNPAVWLVSRRLTEKAGPWDERLSLDDDGEYFCRVVAASERVKFVRQATSLYRMTGYSQLSMTENEKAYESMFLAKTLCIGHLRSLEDSERARNASLILLQRMYSYYYFAERKKWLEQINILASELGGNLTPPRFGPKWDSVRRVIGWRAAKNIMSGAKKYKFMAKILWDRLLYHLSPMDNNRTEKSAFLNHE
jgi:glycosyltransferase involved in cell wall biosynthesis